jgi:ribosomal protein S18 acetylase RimI-like enzyme
MPVMMFQFRPGTAADAEDVSRVVDAVARERRYLARVCGVTEDEARALIHDLEKNGGIQMLALDERTVVGWCNVTPLSTEGMRHVGRLAMGLLPAYRGQGLGRRLLEETLACAFAKGLRRIELEVFASNLPAVRLYVRAGFLTEGRKRRLSLETLRHQAEAAGDPNRARAP